MRLLYCRTVPAQEYADWLPKFQAAKTTMQDREAALDAVAELIERDLILLGATAIEDKLQLASPSHCSSLNVAHALACIAPALKLEQ